MLSSFLCWSICWMFHICLMIHLFRCLDKKLKSLAISLESDFTFPIYWRPSLGCSSAETCFSTSRQAQMPGVGERRNISWKQKRETDLPTRLLSSGHSLKLPDRKSQNWIIFLIPRENAVSKSINLLLKYKEADWGGRCSEEKIPCPQLEVINQSRLLTDYVVEMIEP